MRKKYIFIAFIVLFPSIINIFNNNSEINTSNTDNETKDVSNSNSNITIDVKGEVKTPGVYELESGTIVNEVLKTAGGLTDSADTSCINLAREVNSNEILLVPDTCNQDLININTASKAELTLLTGIGESRAEDIVDYRTNNGNFNSIEELKNVSGIGESTFQKIKDQIII